MFIDRMKGSRRGGTRSVGSAASPKNYHKQEDRHCKLNKLITVIKKLTHNLQHSFKSYYYISNLYNSYYYLHF